MTDSLDALSKLPLFSGFSDAEIQTFVEMSERRKVPQGEVLFEAGSQPQAVYLLVKGSVTVTNAEEEVLLATSPSFIGELSAMTGEDRNLSAAAAEDSEVLAASIDTLWTFLGKNPSFAIRFQRNLLELSARKIGRDRARLKQMKENIVNTQHAMKVMRDALLEGEDNPLHALLFEQLDALIEHNRRIHYLVQPSRLVSTEIRLDDGSVHRVMALSNEWVFFEEPPEGLELNAEFSAVLLLEGKELLISGTVDRVDENEAGIFLDELVSEYEELFNRHLTKAQLLDVVL